MGARGLNSSNVSKGLVKFCDGHGTEKLIELKNPTELTKLAESHN